MSGVIKGPLGTLPIARKLSVAGAIQLGTQVLHDIRLKPLPRPVTVTKTEDVVGIFDSDFNQLFESARPVRANVLEDTTLFKHPLETGYTIADHRIILPIEINMIVKLPEAAFRDVYSAIRAGFIAGNVYTVRTRTGNYPNMILASMPHEERAEDWQGIPLFLTFVELQTNSATYKPLAPRRIADSTTVDKGQQSTGSVAIGVVRKVQQFAREHL